MFRCHQCATVVGPRISPSVVVTATRSVQYQNEDVEGNAAITAGTEIVSEERRCRTCAGEPPLRETQPPDFPTLKAISEAKFEHARKCMKLDRAGREGHGFDECKACKQNMKWFASLPAQILSRILA